ncbi:CGNR zinc finger domain-containing protein, partial [Streptomyces niveus]
FFVRSHPRREWCSADCGNRARVARHYRRRRDAGEAAKA